MIAMVDGHRRMRLRLVRTCAALLLLVAALAPAQESAPSRPSRSFELPASDQAKPFTEPDPIIVTITRPRRNDGVAASRPVDQPWRASIGIQSFKFDESGMTDLKDELYRRAYERIRKTAPFVSERGLLLRADVDAPWKCVQQVIYQCSQARI
jgi:hypothetical protein